MREEDELKTDDNVAYGTPREIMALRPAKQLSLEHFDCAKYIAICCSHTIE